jgi:phosphoglycerate dehydrogenase-like enzyme
MDSRLALSMKPQELTMIKSASAGFPTLDQPAAASRAIMVSAST